MTLESDWDRRYSHPNHVFGYRPNDFLVEASVMLPRRGRVLVLGDGEGRNGVWLAEQGHAVTTVDVSRVAVEKARAHVAALVNCDPREIVWTSGATESNNLALKGAAQFLADRGRHVVTVKTEHKSVLDTVRELSLIHI